MSVTATIALPSQPATGLLEYIPLGGDGIQAPHGVYALEAALSSDGGGGTNTITVEMDPQYSTLVQYVTIAMGSSAAAQITFLQVRNTVCDTYDVNILNVWTSFNGLGQAVVHPAGLILASTGSTTPQVISTAVNTDTETHTLRIRMYLFVKELRQYAPNWMTMFNLPR